MKKEEMISLDELMGGAVTERYQHALDQVIENILDLNTKATAARKITLTLTIKPNDQRDLASFSVEAKTTLAPREAVTTTLMIGMDEDGMLVATEHKKGIIPGQMDLNGEEYGNLRPLSNLK